jgi:hypothetical protein
MRFLTSSNLLLLIFDSGTSHTVNPGFADWRTGVVLGAPITGLLTWLELDGIEVKGRD